MPGGPIVTELSAPPSAEEREFWEREFPDDTPPTGRRRPDPLPRREQRLARVADGPLARLNDRLRDWRADARLGGSVLVLVAVVAGVVGYRIGVGGASAGAGAAAPRAVTPTRPATTVARTAQSTAAKDAPPRIAVHVAGAVSHPGVVDLRNGA